MYWTVTKAKRPTRTHHAAVVVRHDVYSFGGPCKGETCSDVDHIEVHVFDSVSLSWLKLPPVTTGRGEQCSHEIPSMRGGHTAVLVEDTIYIWGGITYIGNYSTNDTYAFDIDNHSWFKARTSGTIPGARCGHSACVLGKFMYVYGGLTINDAFETECNSKIYKLDTNAMVWSLIKTRGTPPLASVSHTATIIGTKMFLFGGWGDQEEDFNNVRVFDTKTSCWLSMPPSSAQLLPEARFGQSAFVYNGELYIFGGCTWKQLDFNDLWRFNPETFVWKKVEPKGKGPSRMYGVSCCVVGDRIILFGGYKGGSTAAANDLHILDFCPALKTLCKVAVIRCRLKRSGLPHNIRWELVAMTSNNRKMRVFAANKPSNKPANKRKKETASPLAKKMKRAH